MFQDEEHSTIKLTNATVVLAARFAGVDVMITIFEGKMAFFSKTNVMIQFV
jgi:hypothetical protein